MDIKKRLHRYSDLKLEHEQLKERIDSIHSQLTGIHSQTFDSVQAFGGTTNDKIGDMVATLSDLETLYIAKSNELMKEMIYIERIVNVLEPRERMLVRKRYMECKKWEDVCVEMNYSWRGIHKLHSKILSKLEKSA